jgi:hypothetical protein
LAERDEPACAAPTRSIRSRHAIHSTTAGNIKGENVAMPKFLIKGTYTADTMKGLKKDQALAEKVTYRAPGT